MNMEMFALEITNNPIFKKIVLVLFCVFLFWKIIRYMCGLLKVDKEPITVLVTGAAGKDSFFFDTFIVFLIHI